MPFTRVFVARGSGRERGDVVVARTGVGSVGFDDPMEIAELRAPEPDGDASGFCRLVKRGRLVRGWAELSVVPVRGSSQTEVRWEEEIRVAGVPGFADPVVAVVGRVVFGRALDHLLRGGPR